jgi:ribosome-associated translation inhibitor RaiA
MSAAAGSSALISYHGLEPSETLTELIRARADQLTQLHERIVSLRVTVEAPHHHRRHGSPYRVRLTLELPGADLIVVGGRPAHGGDEDAHQAVRDAFDALRRRLTSTRVRRSGRQRGHGLRGRAPELAEINRR